MCKDMRNYFDNKVNNEKVKDLEQEVLALKSKVKELRLANKKHNIEISSYKRRLKDSGIDFTSRTKKVIHIIAKAKADGFEGRVIDLQRELASRFCLSIYTIKRIWYPKK